MGEDWPWGKEVEGARLDPSTLAVGWQGRGGP